MAQASPLAHRSSFVSEFQSLFMDFAFFFYTEIRFRFPYIALRLEPLGAMGDGVPADAQRDVGNVADGGAPAPGGSSSSRGEPSSETSACEQRREGGEWRRKRRRVGASSNATSDEEYEFSEIADAINKFTEAYIKIETTKIESKKTAVEHETRMAAMTMEMEERRYKAMMETQRAMAKLVAEAVKGALDRCLDTRDLRDA